MPYVAVRKPKRKDETIDLITWKTKKQPEYEYLWKPAHRQVPIEDHSQYRTFGAMKRLDPGSNLSHESLYREGLLRRGSALFFSGNTSAQSIKKMGSTKVSPMQSNDVITFSTERRTGRSSGAEVHFDAPYRKEDAFLKDRDCITWTLPRIRCDGEIIDETWQKKPRNGEYGIQVGSAMGIQRHVEAYSKDEPKLPSFLSKCNDESEYEDITSRHLPDPLQTWYEIANRPKIDGLPKDKWLTTFG